MSTTETTTRRVAKRTGRVALSNGAYRGILIIMVAIFVALVAWYVISIIVQSKPVFSTLGFSWIFQKVWNPSHNRYGLLPFILGTIETTAIALVLAVPIGLGTAIALAHLVPARIRPHSLDGGRATRSRTERCLRPMGAHRAGTPLS